MDDIFGGNNFVAQITAQTNPRGRSLRQDLAKTHEFILAFAKNINEIKIRQIPKSEKTISEYRKKDDKGYYRLLRLRNTGIQFLTAKHDRIFFFPSMLILKMGKLPYLVQIYIA